MVSVMEAKYGKANRVWVFDRGMVSEKNLEFMREANARYLVGTPKSMLKKFEQDLLEQTWEEVQPGVEVKLVASAQGAEEIFVLCRSRGRKEKENAILERFVNRLGDKLAKLAERAEQGKIRDRQKVERQIGRRVPVCGYGEGERQPTRNPYREERRALPKGHGNRGQLYPAYQLEGDRS